MQPALSFYKYQEFYMSGISANQEQQLRELVANGNKIAAIKLYREITNLGLKEAKDAVEAIASGASFITSTPIRSSLQNDTLLEEHIKHFLAEQKKIEAVKLYREANHCGLKEAKDAVDLIQAGMRRDGYSNMPMPPTSIDDPFADETLGTRRKLVIAAIIFLIIAGVFVFFFIFQSGF
jgi:ribosomal protein L7/L12